MNGILLIDKPTDWTSFDVIAKLRGILATRKLGHSGTLDPMATGVLPVFVGQAAKAVDLQPRHDKTYQALVQFGLCTDTGDVTGTTLEQSDQVVSLEALVAALPAFVGEGLQTPPMYSAVKINGVPLYKLARQGLTVERKARPVTIHSLECTGQQGPNQFWLQMHCSKGTYVRTLVEDLGAALGCPACLAQLRRTQAGAFELAGCHTLQEVQAAKEAGCLDRLLLGVETVFTHLPLLQLDAEGESRMLRGAPVYRVQAAEGICRLHGPAGFLGLGRVEGGTLQVEKLFVERV